MNSLKMRNMMMTTKSGHYFQFQDPTIKILCLSQGMEIKMSTLTKTEWEEATSENVSLLTDLLFYKDAVSGKFSCQASSPNPKMMTQAQCEGLLGTLASGLNITKQTVDEMEPHHGLNIVYLGPDGFHITNPAAAVCRENMDPIFTMSDKLQEWIIKITSTLQRIDQAIGSKFMQHLEESILKCGLPATIMQEYARAEEWKCHKRTKRFSMISLGGNSGVPQDILDSINSNFKTLHEAQVQLLNDLESLKAADGLLTRLEQVNQIQTNNLQNSIIGIEAASTIKNRLSHYYLSIQNTLQAVLGDLQLTEARLQDLIRDLDDLVLNKRSHCHGLVCGSPAESIITVSKSGIMEVTRGAMISNKKIQVLSCHLTEKGYIMRDNKKEASYSNSSGVQIGDNYYSTECIEDYKKCEKSSFKSPNKDLIDSKFFMTIEPQGLSVQCPVSNILKSGGAMVACNLTPHTVQLPFSLVDSEKMYGYADALGIGHLKQSEGIPWDQYLSGSHERTYYQKEAPVEILDLVRQSFSSIASTEKINSHHITVGTAFATSAALGLISCLCSCLCCKPCKKYMKFKKARNDAENTDSSHPDNTWRNLLGRLAIWKRANASNMEQPPIPSPTAPSFRQLEEADQQQRNKNIAEVASKILELTR